MVYATIRIFPVYCIVTIIVNTITAIGSPDRSEDGAPACICHNQDLLRLLHRHHYCQYHHRNLIPVEIEAVLLLDFHKKDLMNRKLREYLL